VNAGRDETRAPVPSQALNRSPNTRPSSICQKRPAIAIPVEVIVRDRAGRICSIRAGLRWLERKAEASLGLEHTSAVRERPRAGTNAAIGPHRECLRMRRRRQVARAQGEGEARSRAHCRVRERPGGADNAASGPQRSGIIQARRQPGPGARR